MSESTSLTHIKSLVIERLPLVIKLSQLHGLRGHETGFREDGVTTLHVPAWLGLNTIEFAMRYIASRSAAEGLCGDEMIDSDAREVVKRGITWAWHRALSDVPTEAVDGAIGIEIEIDSFRYIKSHPERGHHQWYPNGVKYRYLCINIEYSLVVKNFKGDPKQGFTVGRASVTFPFTHTSLPADLIAACDNAATWGLDCEDLGEMPTGSTVSSYDTQTVVSTPDFDLSVVLHSSVQPTWGEFRLGSAILEPECDRSSFLS